MKKIFEFLLRNFLQFLLSRRYDVEVKGLENVEGNGLLLLANHVSILDAAIFQVFTWNRFRARPFATSKFTKVSYLKPIFRLVRAITAPDCTVANNSVKVNELEKSYQEILDGLKNGDNILFYPSGHIKISGKEILAGQSGLHTLLTKEPATKLALVRFTGLWGSRFSAAPHGKTPDLKKELLGGIKNWVKHFFVPPKRKVIIELEPYTVPQPLPSRIELNKGLENWFNAPFQGGDEPIFPSFEPVSFFPPVEEGEMTPLEKEVAFMMAKVAKCPIEKINKSTHLFYDLGLDSLEATALFDLIEQKANLSHLYSPELITPYHIALQIEKRWQSHRMKEAIQKDKKKIEKLSVQKKSFKTVASFSIEDVLEALEKSRLKYVAYDEFLGLITPKSLKKRIESGINKALSDIRQEIPILFPHSLERAIATLSVYFSAKKPIFIEPTQVPSTKGAIYSSASILEYWHGLDLGSAVHRVEEFFSVKRDKPKKMAVITFNGGHLQPPLAILKEPKEEEVFEAIVRGIPILSGRSQWIDEVLQ